MKRHIYRSLVTQLVAQNVNQAAGSKLERRADMYVSTLREFIAAMGGELEITARFPDGSVRINQFEDSDATSVTRAAKK